MAVCNRVIHTDEGTPDRRIGLAAGIIGGVVGLYALRIYWQEIAPLLFPPDAHPDSPYLNPADPVALVGQQYQEGESSTEAVGRVAYELLSGQVVTSAAERSALADKVLLAWTVTSGAAYGATRTTTHIRDFASGVFYGIRLWLGDTWISALLGFRPAPAAFTPRQHLWRLSAIWVYSFTTTAITRIVYRLLGGPA